LPLLVSELPLELLLNLDYLTLLPAQPTGQGRANQILCILKFFNLVNLKVETLCRSVVRATCGLSRLQCLSTETGCWKTIVCRHLHTWRWVNFALRHVYFLLAHGMHHLPDMYICCLPCHPMYLYGVSFFSYSFFFHPSGSKLYVY
jgi:hypothetical protein